MKRAYNFKDLTGQRFGKWTVINEAEKRNYRPQWFCRCDCGTERIVQGLSLTNGESQSCGCSKGASYSMLGQTANKQRSSAYGAWIGMKQRCTNPTVLHYARYGGRGIKVCARWMNSFQHFMEDMGQKPTPKHTLDRIDNNGHYEPGNCRWATRKEQAQNRTHNIRWEHRQRNDKGQFV